MASSCEVGVVTGLDPGVQLAAGDGHGGLGDAGQGLQGATAGPPADGGPGDGGDQRGGGQGEGQDAEGAGQLVEGEDLEVGGVHGGQGHADHQLGRAAEREELGGRRARQDEVPLPTGMAFSPTEIDVAYHWPALRSTEREPGRVSADSSSCSTWVPGERSEFWTREALAKAWRWSAVWRSLRKLCRAVK